eukprot:57575_1
MSSLVFIFLLQIVISEPAEPKRAIHCPEDQDCTILCTESHCLNSHITCPVHNDCSITCNHHSCHETTIDATESSSFNLYLHPKLYSNLSAYLPPSSANDPRTHIHQTPVKTTSFKNGGLRPSDYTLTLFAINGFNDLMSTAHLPRGIMYCQPQYTSFCSFSAASVSCTDEHHLCAKTAPTTLQSHTRRLLQSERVIDVHANGGVYDNNADITLAPQAYGWSFDFHGGNQVGLLTVSGSSKVIGPFRGTNTAVMDYIISISQPFVCSVPADVSVSYRVFWCGDTEVDDYAKLFLNDIEQSSATVWDDPSRGASATVWSFVPTSQDDALNTSCAWASTSTYRWRFTDITYATNLIAGTYANPAFTVRFDLGLSADDEWGGIADVKVRCTAITIAPTQMPSIPPTITGTYPPTAQPTQYPTQPVYEYGNYQIIFNNISHDEFYVLNNSIITMEKIIKKSYEVSNITVNVTIIDLILVKST